MNIQHFGNVFLKVHVIFGAYLWPEGISFCFVEKSMILLKEDKTLTYSNETKTKFYSNKESGELPASWSSLYKNWVVVSNIFYLGSRLEPPASLGIPCWLSVRVISMPWLALHGVRLELRWHGLFGFWSSFAAWPTLDWMVCTSICVAIILRHFSRRTWLSTFWMAVGCLQWASMCCMQTWTSPFAWFLRLVFAWFGC